MKNKSLRTAIGCFIAKYRMPVAESRLFYAVLRPIMKDFSKETKAHFLTASFKNLPRMEKLQPSLMTIDEAEARYARNLRQAFLEWSAPNKEARAGFALVAGRLTAVFSKLALRRKYGNPSYINPVLLASKLKLEIMTVRARLQRSSFLPSIIVKRTLGGKFKCYDYNDVKRHMRFWEFEEHLEGSIRCGRKLKAMHC